MSTRNDLLEQIRNLIAGGSTSTAVEYEDIGIFATTDDQTPTGTGSAGKIRVNFGTGGDTSGGEFTILSDGTIVTNSNTIQYTFNLVLRVARTGAAGNSIIMGRLLYSEDGNETDTIQIGDTASIIVDDDDTVWRESFEFTFSPAVNSRLWFEIARDEDGNNSGLLSAPQPTGTLLTDTPAWNQSDSASLRISKLSVVTE